jgi:predicted ATP-grasp superfamily ATP-dependent carboligase
MGDTDLVRALALAGVRPAVFAPPGDPARRSRDVAAALPWRDHWLDHDAVADVLVAYAATCPEPPVLLPQTDPDLLTVSRRRERLARPFRLLLADAELVEASVDKAAFAALAERLGLPVPASQRLDPAREAPEDVRLAFPLVLKPLLRRAEAWSAVERSAKAVHAASADDLARLWPQLAAAGIPLLAQEAVPGDETRIESWHAYVDAGGAHVAGFTGRKIRTLPARYGHSSALETTAARDVEEHGRAVVERLGVRGVVKADFKRAPDGSLWLLEINARFTLWHHLAAVAGLNIPALVHADLLGRPRPAVRAARPGVTWCHPLYDVRAARAQGVSLAAWVRFVRGCDAVTPGTLAAPVLRRLPSPHPPTTERPR